MNTIKTVLGEALIPFDLMPRGHDLLGYRIHLSSLCFVNGIHLGEPTACWSELWTTVEVVYQNVRQSELALPLGLVLSEQTEEALLAVMYKRVNSELRAGQTAFIYGFRPGGVPRITMQHPNLPTPTQTAGSYELIGVVERR